MDSNKISERCELDDIIENDKNGKEIDFFWWFFFKEVLKKMWDLINEVFVKRVKVFNSGRI